jgi:hypothetical protein
MKQVDFRYQIFPSQPIPGGDLGQSSEHGLVVMQLQGTNPDVLCIVPVVLWC